MTKKKFTYKVPSMVALTLAGTALTSHQAQAADDVQNKSTNENVLDDKNTLKQSEQIKSEVSKPTANISGTQSYQDPTQVEQTLANEVNTYDAELDELNSEQTPSQDTYNPQISGQEDQANTQSEANEVTENNQDSEDAQSIEQEPAQNNTSSDLNQQDSEETQQSVEDTSNQNIQHNEGNSTDDTTTAVDNSQAVENAQTTEQNTAQDNTSSDVNEQSSEDAQQSEENTNVQNNEDKSTDDTTTPINNNQTVENTQATEQNTAQDNTSSDVNEQNSEDTKATKEDTSNKDVQDNQANQNSEQNKEDNTSSDVSEQDSEDAKATEEDASNEDVQDDETNQSTEQNKEDNTSSDVNEQNSEDTKAIEEDASNKDVQDDQANQNSEQNKEDNTSSDVNEQNPEDTKATEEDVSNKVVQDDETNQSTEQNKEDNTSSDVNEQNPEDAKVTEEDASNEDVQDDETNQSTEQNKEDNTSSDVNEQNSEDAKATEEDASNEDFQDGEDAKTSEDNKVDDSSDVNEQNSEDAKATEEDASNEDVQDDETNQSTEQNKEDNTSSDVSEQNSEDAKATEEDASNEDFQDGEDAKTSEDNKIDDSSDVNEQNSEDAKATEDNKVDDSSDVSEQDSEDTQQSEEDASNEDVQDDEDAKTTEDNKVDDSSDVSEQSTSEDSKATSTATAVATKPSTPSTTATTVSTEATPKLRVASTNVNNTLSTRSAITREAGTTSSLPAYSPQVSSSLNNYIRNNNFQAPNYEQDIASYLPQYNYRYGKPEGIVLHETANDNSTITGEINYMKNNYNSAFVHAYIDGNRIIETANTDYLAWGAGPAANDRFIHVELVHTHDYDSFARSINNYADYAATNLQYYGLSPDSAEYDGQGTVWTHQAVSTFLGGSNHTDPHGYLASYNYSYDELYDLIYEKYLIKTGQVAPWGATSSGSTSGKDESTNTDGSSNTGGSGSTGGSSNTGSTVTPPKTGSLTVEANNGVGRINTTNDGLYATVYDHQGKKTDRTNQTLKVTKSAKIGNENFYLVTDYNKGNLIGWVHQNDVDYNTAKPVTAINKTYNIKPGEILYTVPWGTSSQKAGTVSGNANQTFKATKQQQIGKTNYVYGSVNDLSGWVSLSKLSSPSSTVAPPANTGQLSVTNLTNQQGTVAKTNHGVYTSVYDKQGVQKPYVNGNTYKLSKKATLGSNSFYLITDNKTNSNIGWMQTGDITVNEAATKNTANPTQSVSKIGQLNNTNSGIKTKVNDTKAKDASKLSGRTFNITKQRTQDDNTYVLIQNSNQNTPLGWVNTKDINTRDLSKTSAKNGQFTVKSTNNGLYAVPWGTKAQQLDSLKNVKNNQFNASKSVKVDKDEYVYGNVKNKTGWIAAKDLNTNNKVATETQKSDVTKSAVTPYKFDYVIYNADGSYYLDPTSNQPAGSLNDFYESIFTVFETQVINGVTWYHGKLSNGQMVWIKEEDLRKELIKYYQSGLTLDEAVAIQAGLKTKPQIQHTPGKWEDATPIEIKNAMDTGKLAQDPTQKYQFLRLDKSQDIASADLDKLLVGKGILEGQGEAFSEAAKAYNINEVYLISHALLETGDGTSKLANGGDVVDDKVVTDGPNKYYNMFGIGAVDSDAVKQGFATAKSNGWDTVKKAIVGGAKFISSSYISQGQNTLYKMRWNPENPGEHQYATDVRWAEHNATRIKGFYDSMGKLGKYFDVNTYKA
ncbi:GW dipeptide domain-containing protein [Staphylococcus equorum]|uniref:Bifunctional autolysin n=1 Tax=Staphylococcus equorum TaxID=246432 RepID=A0A9X4QZ51_9STAP|nr:GW dipeptide domain-containing protein [Staphylococcus equorum]MDG0820031.1 GW dipeptide domain-containing protein [Staphylococcus equorum]MDG0840696.1 GW dipeptide domain-containing protein [Staphylococcus equorum]MDG0846355.1 GW dipeptide domain-containing protein [Staphylococcus equorum]